MSGLAREAEWLIKEETENAVARREGYVLSPQFFRRAKLQTGIAVAMASLLGIVATATWTHYHYGDEGLVLLSIAGLSLGLIPLARHWEKRQEASRGADREMRESFGLGGRFVSMLVLQGDTPTGEDRGMLWFEDGRLYFSGHRTSFGLVPSQIRGEAVLRVAVPRVCNEVNLILDRSGPTGWTSLSFGLPVPDEAHPYAHRELKTDLDDWKRKGQASGPGQWPPTRLGPGVVPMRRLAVAATFHTTLLIVGPAVVCGYLVSVWVGLIVALCSVIGMPGLRYSRANLLWRALRDRRRLERSQWRA